MNIADLEAFVVVAELRSIVAAAGKIHLSQSAITRRLQSIEEQLGITLFRRDSRPLMLTAEGREAYQHAQAVLTAAAELKSALTRTDAVAGEFNIGVSVSVGHSLLTPSLQELCRTYPKLRVRTSHDDSHLMLKRLERREIDAAIVALPDGRPLPEGISGESIATIELAVVTGNGSALRDGMGIADLSEERWVVRTTGCTVRALLDNALRQSHMPFHIALECSDPLQKLAFIESGLGIGLHPPHLISPTEWRSRVRMIRLRDFRPRLSLSIAYVGRRGRLAGPIRCLCDTLRASATEIFAVDYFDMANRLLEQSEIRSPEPAEIA